jgi:hypothetical protein
VVVCFVDIGRIVDHNCLKVAVCFVEISGIVDHHCLEVLFVLLILVEFLTITA